MSYLSFLLVPVLVLCTLDISFAETSQGNDIFNFEVVKASNGLKVTAGVSKHMRKDDVIHGVAKLDGTDYKEVISNYDDLLAEAKKKLNAKGEFALWVTRKGKPQWMKPIVFRKCPYSLPFETHSIADGPKVTKSTVDGIRVGDVVGFVADWNGNRMIEVDSSTSLYQLLVACYRRKDSNYKVSIYNNDTQKWTVVTMFEPGK